MRRALVHAVSECSRIVYSMPDAREQQETLSRLSYCFGHHDLQQRAVCVLEGTGAVDSRNIDLGNGESVLQAVFTVPHRVMSSVVP